MNPFIQNEKNFEIAYNEYADMLYRLAFSYMEHREDAEDVVSDVFTKYMCDFHRPMDKEHEKAWFIRVTINQCHDALRKRSYRMHASLEEVTEMAVAIQEQGTLMDMLRKLPERYKGVIILHYLEGYSVDEVAKIVGISVSAVKMRLKRSRDLLKEKLEQE